MLSCIQFYGRAPHEKIKLHVSTVWCRAQTLYRDEVRDHRGQDHHRKGDAEFLYREGRRLTGNSMTEGLVFVHEADNSHKSFLLYRQSM